MSQTGRKLFRFFRSPWGLQAVEVFFKPQFDLGYSWDTQCKRIKKSNWIIPEMPEGKYRAVALNKEGVCVASKILQLGVKPGETIVIR